MKARFVWILLLMVFNWSCSQNQVNRPRKIEKKVSGRIVVESEKKNFTDVFELVGVVFLETSDDSLVGRVKKVTCDEEGYIYLLDRRSSKKLFRFDENGKYLNYYGEHGESPHGYTSLNDFTLSEERVYILSGRKLLAFDKEGGFIHSVKLMPEYPSTIFFHADYVMGYDPTSLQNISVYAGDLSRVDSFASFNNRFSNHDWRPRNAVAVVGDRVVVANVFNTTLNFFKYGEEVRSVYLFDDNPEMVELTTLSELNPSQESRLDSLTHSFSFVYAIENQILLEEFSSVDSISRLHLLDPVSWHSQVIDDVYKEKERFYDYFVGSGGDLLFAVLESEETFKVFRTKFPSFPIPDFDPSKNPFLLKIKVKNK